MSFNSQLKKASQSTTVALSGVTAGSVAGGPVLALAANDAECDSLVANVSVGLTTSTATVTTKWQVSNDNSTWLDLKGLNSPAAVTVAAAGTGSLVTTAYAHACPINVSYPYVRLAVQMGVATGAAGDNVVISYNYRKRQE